MRTLLPALLLAVAQSGCGSPKDSQVAQNHLGSINHQFSISEPAKTDFEEGLLLLHSFEYQDSREAFQKAVMADDKEVMAYWGEAMTHYRALWGLQDVDAGRKVMAALGETRQERLQGITDPLEKDFWEGLEFLYGEGELADRNKAYSDHMAELYGKYPKNQEVAAFYALGLMWSVPVGRDEEVFERSARVAAGILEENPTHPGGLHYMIHAYDDPNFAGLAKNAADLYSTVAPDAAHALHMPSHIYLALGRWEDVIRSNESSYGASVNRMNRKGLGDEARGFHSYSWLHYGYLQQGRYDDADSLLRDMLQYTPSANTSSARSYLISMQSAALAETGLWSLAEGPLEVEYSDLGLSTRASHHFFQSSLAYQQNQPEVIQSHIEELITDLAAAELLVTNEGITLCSAGPTRYAPNENELKRARVVLSQMKALSSSLNDELERTEDLLQQAVEMEAATGYSFGPPDISLPSFEQYGWWLLDQDRPQEALEQFEQSLERAPGRNRAIKGQQEALRMLEAETADA